MVRPVVKDSTNESVVIRIIDESDGTPETGVEHNTSGIDLWYRREGATKTSITEAALSALDDAHSDGGIEHIGDGYYRLDLPDAAFADGANGVAVGGTVTGMVVIGCYVPLLDVDPYDSVRGGLTALPNAAADAAGGLPISDAGGLDLDTLDTNVSNILKASAIIVTTITVIDTNSGTLAAGPTAYDPFDDHDAIIIGTDAEEYDVVHITSYSAATRLVSYTTPGFTVATGDTVIILPSQGCKLQDTADAIETDTQDLQTQIGAAGAGLTAVPWNSSWDAEVQSEVADALEETIADSIPSDGTRPSVKQALYMLTQFMLERAVSSTTVTVKKPDGSTSLFTLALDDATSPTSITRDS